MSPGKLNKRVIGDRLAWLDKMVHFYHEVTFEELYEICCGELGDLLKIRNAFLDWIERNPDRIDGAL